MLTRSTHPHTRQDLVARAHAVHGRKLSSTGQAHVFEPRREHVWPRGTCCVVAARAEARSGRLFCEPAQTAKANVLLGWDLAASIQARAHSF